MNLDAVFRDYEARLASLSQQQNEADAREQYSVELLKVQNLDRLAGQLSETLTLSLLGAQKWQGVLRTVGLGWIQLDVETGALLVPSSSIMWWEGRSNFSSVDAISISRKLSFAFALRSLVRSRMSAKIYLIDGQEMQGMLERVGADFVEIKMRQPQLAGALSQFQIRVIPIASIKFLLLLNTTY